MNGLAPNINKQYHQLIREGLTPQQACECLDLDIDAAQMAMMSQGAEKNKEVTVTELLERFKPEAINILIDVARTAERDADKVKACQILLEGKGVMPEVNAAAATVLLDKFAKMKQITGLDSNVRVIDVGGTGINDDMMAMAK